MTHDAVDAAALADRLVIVERGTVTQEGPVREVLAAPATEVAAKIAGLERVVGVARGGAFVREGLRLSSMDAASRALAARDGLSLAAVAPIGLVLDRSPWGLTRPSTALATFIVIAVASIIAALRRMHLTNQDPYAVMLAIPRVPPPIDWDRATQAIAGLVILGTLLLMIGAAPIVRTQIIGEPLTEFALYNPIGKPEFFPRQVVVNEPIEIQLSVVNNEGAPATFGLEKSPTPISTGSSSSSRRSSVLRFW